MSNINVANFRRWDYVKITILGFATTALWQSLHSIILPQRLLDFVPEAQKNTYLGIITLCGLLLAMFAQPIAGAISDRSTFKWGRRRPYIFWGMIISILLLPGFALAGSFAAIFVVYCLLQVAANTAQGPYQAFLPEMVPEKKRGMASGFRSLFELTGGVGFVLFAGWNDLTFPLHGLIQGNYIRAFLNKYLKDKTFYDIQRPLKIVACDCLTMRQVVFDSGRLIDAVMASVSIPGVFQPYKIADHYYIDGGILNPLPTDVLVDAGARKIIAVNVLPSPEEIERTRELITKRALLEAARRSPFKKAVSLIQHKQEGFLKPNIFDVIVSSVQSMEYALAQLSSLSQSDVTLHPDMTAMFWSAFDHAPDLIKRGEEETLLHLSQIKELVARSE